MIIFQLIQKFQLRGAEMFAAQLSQHLEASGNQVFLVSLFPGTVELPFSGVKISLNRPIDKRFFDYQGWKELSELIAKHNPDVIQCNAGDTLKFAVLSKKIFKWKQPIVARNASMVSLYINNPITKAINHWLYRNVDFVISVSENSKKDLNTIFPETIAKSTVIPVGIDPHECKAVVWRGGADAQKHIIHVGGFSFEKNHEGLLSIFKKFVEKRPNVHLHLLGEGPKRAAIEQLAVNLKLNDKMTFYGWVSNPMDYICKADVLVLPSIIEGLPGVILEAMISKKPVVAYNVGGISEVVQLGVTGYLVEKNEESNFAEALEKAIYQDNEKLIQNAYDLVSQKYNNIIIAQQFDRIYHQLKR
ncbi:glycosyltransferase [Flavobacterium sp. XGLA_31]|uniref:glycosyltransferase n=1 Tax=Flavobacterium sp. XGLA_31 TaxID=3447666 RepID=UPI003F39BC40